MEIAYQQTPTFPRSAWTATLWAKKTAQRISPKQLPTSSTLTTASRSQLPGFPPGKTSNQSCRPKAEPQTRQEGWLSTRTTLQHPQQKTNSGRWLERKPSPNGKHGGRRPRASNQRTLPSPLHRTGRYRLCPRTSQALSPHILNGNQIADHPRVHRRICRKIPTNLKRPASLRVWRTPSNRRPRTFLLPAPCRGKTSTHPLHSEHRFPLPHFRD